MIQLGIVAIFAGLLIFFAFHLNKLKNQVKYLEATIEDLEDDMTNDKLVEETRDLLGELRVLIRRMDKERDQDNWWKGE